MIQRQSTNPIELMKKRAKRKKVERKENGKEIDVDTFQSICILLMAINWNCVRLIPPNAMK